MNKQVDKIFAVINLGSSYISAMLGSKLANGRISPISYAKAPSQGSIIHGCIHNVTELSKIVSGLLDTLQQGLHDKLQEERAIIKRIYVGLDCQSMRSHTFKAQLNFDADGVVIEPEHLKRLSEQAKEKTFAGHSLLHISDARYFLDGRKESRPSGVRCRHIEAIYQLITIRKDIEANIREVFEHRLDLSIAGLLVSPVVEAMASLTREELTLGAAYINMGGGTTSISIYKDRLLNGLCVLPLGGINVTRDLMGPFRLMEGDAEKVKLRHGSMDLEVDKKALITAQHINGTGEKSILHYEINSHIHARMKELTKNILTLLQEMDPELNLSGIVFSGGATSLRGYRDYLDSTEIGDCIRFAVARPEMLSEEESPNLLSEYHSVLALMAQAKIDCIEYPVEGIDSLFGDEEIEGTLGLPTASTGTTESQPDEEDQPEDDNSDYTFGDQDGSWDDPLDEDNNEEIHSDNEKLNKGGFFAKVGTKIFGAINQFLGNEDEEEY